MPINEEVRKIVDELTNNFSIDTLTTLFRIIKNDTFNQNIQKIFFDNQNKGLNNEEKKDQWLFDYGHFVGDLKIDEGDLSIVCVKVTKELSEKSGKKKQYEFAKNFLKKIDSYIGGFFIFYDSENNFRFSFVHDIPLGSGKKKWSNFRRYTYFVSKNQTNRTFLTQFSENDFSSIDSIIKAFSVEKVTKEFYQQIANWYFWAVHKSRFPDDCEKLENGRNIAIIRLITRLIFVWFMKEKRIISEIFFDIKKISKILKNFDIRDSNYYKAILQNLFFASLNEKEKNEKNFRYLDYFINKDEAISLFKNIPFLNGGLFECLDISKNDPENEWGRTLYIDGFSDFAQYQPNVPNYLFFIDEEITNLSEDYGNNNYANTNVSGIINILKSYNFTIDENSPVDQEVALDPELLGKVFENLLASYNPETAKTARNATGSFYTPRQIVDYMVEESLKNYFISNLKDKISDIENKIEKLFEYNDEDNDLGLSDDQIDYLINLIENIKILDPAAGSGAFLMGALHKLSYILSKLDPHNIRWKEKNKRIIEKQVKDEVLRNKLLEKIEADFSENELDYGRKLYLIKNCLYGVDIQQIAIQISKLRFFISLLVDQKIDYEKDNFGIQPLPNLETKLVCADSLIAIETEEEKKDYIGHLFEATEFIDLENELLDIRSKYFMTYDPKEKMELKRKDRDIRLKIKSKIGFELRENFQNQLYDKIKKVSSYDPYKVNSSSPWFDPEWMFGVKDGFDIVIGNPPYGNIMSRKQKEFVNQFYKYSTTLDIASPFVEIGSKILGNNGILMYIITFAITFNRDFSKTRQLLRNLFGKVLILSFDRDRCRTFESMSQSVSILKAFNKNIKEKEGIFTSRMFRETPDIYNIKVSNADKYLFPIGTSYSYPHRLPKLGEKINIIILEKILKQGRKIKDIINRGNSNIWIRTSGNYWYNAWDKCPYESSEVRELYVDNLYKNFLIVLMNSSLFYFWFRIFGDGRHMNFDIFKEFPIPDLEKIKKFKSLLEKSSFSFLDALWSVFDSRGKRFLTSDVKDKIDLLDLALGRYLYLLNHEEILHIMNYDKEVRVGLKLKQYETLANKILYLTKSPDYETNYQKQEKVKELEKQIDQFVYKLYNLSEEEIKIIEGGK